MWIPGILYYTSIGCFGVIVLFKGIILGVLFKGLLRFSPSKTLYIYIRKGQDAPQEIQHDPTHFLVQCLFHVSKVRFHSTGGEGDLKKVVLCCIGIVEATRIQWNPME